MVMTYINPVLRVFNTAVDYLKGNAWHICLLLGALWVLKTQVIDPRRKSSTAYRLNDNDKNSSGILSKSRKNRQEEMLRIRQKQQEAMDRRAREAATQKKPDDDDDDSQKKKKKAPGVLRKPPAASRGGGYNPMQPWTASQGGGGYKPQKRMARRG